MQYKKWEMPETRYAQTRAFLIHFLYRTNGVDTWELQTSKTTAKPKSRLINDTQRYMHSACIDVVVAVVFDLHPLGTM